MNSSLSDKARGYQASPDLLKDRVVVITGAGDGIGRELAEKCAAHGATVVLVGRTTSKLEEVYDAIEAAGGPTPAIIPLDLAKADETELRAVGSALAEHFDCVHGLVHNAALLGDRQPMASTSYSTWVELMQVNVNAPLVLTQAILPLMEQAEDASIIFTSSGVGRRGRAYWGAYATSKFANEGMMEVLADELENTSNIRANSLNPGATNTSMRRTAYPAEKPTTNPSPEELMPSYLFLLGVDSVGVNGEKLSAQ